MPTPLPDHPLPCDGLVHGRLDCTHHDQIQWLRGFTGVLLQRLRAQETEPVHAALLEYIADLERRLRGEPVTLRR